MTDDKIRELKEATREANEVLKDLRRAIKEGRKLVDDAAEAAISERMKPVVKEGLDEFGQALEKAIKVATDGVFARFDQIADMLLGEDKASKRKGLPSVPELIEQKRQLNGP